MGINKKIFVDEKEVADYVCTICTDVSYPPSTTKCGHIFCTECITNWFKNKKTCPNCNQTTTFEENAFNQRVISSKNVQCLNKKCKFKNTYSEYLKHKNNCQFENIQLKEWRELRSEVANLKDQITLLKEENNQLKNQIQMLSSSAFVCKVEKLYHSNVSFKHTFVVHGLKFEVLVYPLDGSEQTVGIYLGVMDDIRPVVKWKISILGLGDPIVYSFEKNFKEIDRTNRWGRPSAIEKSKNPWICRNVNEFTIVITIESICIQ